MKIKPFNALRPPLNMADKVASPPYDVLSVEEARELCATNPSCFLHITIPEVDLPDDTPSKSPTVYAQAGKALTHFIDQGYLKREDDAHFYLYVITMGEHTQQGIVACSSTEEYDAGLIKKHEFTRQAPEEDRTRHIESLNAQTGPVFLTYRNQPAIDSFVDELAATAPEVDFTAEDGIRHQLWTISDTAKVESLFASVPATYIADGHHRAAASARVARDRRANDPDATGNEEYNGFLSVLFPANQLHILPYNRIIRDLGGMTAEAFLAKVGEIFSVTPCDHKEPKAPRHTCMYLAGKWYELSWDDPQTDRASDALDVAVLQRNLFSGLLGIDDPRKDERIAFIGGIRGVKELMMLVDTGKAAAAFAMYPTGIDQLMAISDDGDVMPPKSTWFEPKLRSGLFVHTLD